MFIKVQRRFVFIFTVAFLLSPKTKQTIHNKKIKLNL